MMVLAPLVLPATVGGFRFVGTPRFDTDL